jgi:hypothetical protein
LRRASDPNAPGVGSEPSSSAVRLEAITKPPATIQIPALTRSIQEWSLIQELSPQFCRFADHTPH